MERELTKHWRENCYQIWNARRTGTCLRYLMSSEESVVATMYEETSHRFPELIIEDEDQTKKF